MKIGLRADASESQGTGHLMRCLTLAEALLSRGHRVELFGTIDGVPWLSEAIEASGVTVIGHPPDVLEPTVILKRELTGLVVDSYRIPAEDISRFNENVPCLAVIDGDSRGISASLFLDQNLGAQRGTLLETDAKWLGGHRFALIRDAVLQHRAALDGPPPERPLRVVAFLGGTDPRGLSVDTALKLIASCPDAELTMVTPRRWLGSVQNVFRRHPRSRALESTPRLPDLLGEADIVVSAAGTSAWDVCAMGRPSVLVAVVDNQMPALDHILDARLALTVDAVGSADDAASMIAASVARLVRSPELRKELSRNCLTTFDGLGKHRVVEVLEQEWAQAPGA